MSVTNDAFGARHDVAAVLVKVSLSAAEVRAPFRLCVETGWIVGEGGVVGRLPWGPRTAIKSRSEQGWTYTVEKVNVTLIQGKRPAATAAILGSPREVMDKRLGCLAT